jgi:hypothetical protein
VGRRVSGARVIFVAASSFVCLLACWLEWSVREVECAEPLVLTTACKKYLSLSYLFWSMSFIYLFIIKTKRCGFLLSRHGDQGPKLLNLAISSVA